MSVSDEALPYQGWSSDRTHVPTALDDVEDGYKVAQEGTTGWVPEVVEGFRGPYLSCSLKDEQEGWRARVEGRAPGSEGKR